MKLAFLAVYLTTIPIGGYTDVGGDIVPYPRVVPGVIDNDTGSTTGLKSGDASRTDSNVEIHTQVHEGIYDIGENRCPAEYYQKCRNAHKTYRNALEANKISRQVIIGTATASEFKLGKSHRAGSLICEQLMVMDRYVWSASELGSKNFANGWLRGCHFFESATGFTHQIILGHYLSGRVSFKVEIHGYYHKPGVKITFYGELEN